MTSPAPCGSWPTRRDFLRTSAALAVALPGLAPASPAASSDDSDTIVGPRKGYSPQIGTLTSMMGFMRSQVYASTKGMSVQELDFLFDEKANRIGALLLHLVATETYYQLATFEGKKWDSWADSVKQKWDIPMNLGDAARKTITGNNLDYYVNLLKETREKTLAEFRKRDDQWLMAIDKDFPGDQPTITANGSTSPSTRPITTAKSNLSKAAFRARNRVNNQECPKLRRPRGKSRAWTRASCRLTITTPLPRIFHEC